MFSLKDCYDLFKAEGHSITDYELILGGFKYAPNLNKGAIIISLINSEILTSQSKEWLSNANDSDLALVKESSFIQLNFQLDCYKANDDNVDKIQAFHECFKLQEWLKGLYVSDYLRGLDSEILPNYSVIQFTTEAVDNKLINRAFFEFSIVTKHEISEFDNVIDSIAIETKLLQGDNNG